jgi:hypothetical protein
LKKKIVLKLFTIWEVPDIDLFASHQTQIYCSWNPDHLAYAIDALTIPLNNMFAYAYPPICLIPKILQHMTQYNCQLILIAPHCTTGLGWRVLVFGWCRRSSLIGSFLGKSAINFSRLGNQCLLSQCGAIRISWQLYCVMCCRILGMRHIGGYA